MSREAYEVASPRVESITIIYHLDNGEEMKSSAVAGFRLEMETREHEGVTQSRAHLTTEWKDQEFFDGTEPT